MIAAPAGGFDDANESKDVDAEEDNTDEDGGETNDPETVSIQQTLVSDALVAMIEIPYDNTEQTEDANNQEHDVGNQEDLKS